MASLLLSEESRMLSGSIKGIGNKHAMTRAGISEFLNIPKHLIVIAAQAEAADSRMCKF
jgi:hypothetical protein